MITNTQLKRSMTAWLSGNHNLIDTTTIIRVKKSSLPGFNEVRDGVIKTTTAYYKPAGMPYRNMMHVNTSALGMYREEPENETCRMAKQWADTGEGCLEALASGILGHLLDGQMSTVRTPESTTMAAFAVLSRTNTTAFPLSARYKAWDQFKHGVVMQDTLEASGLQTHFTGGLILDVASGVNPKIINPGSDGILFLDLLLSLVAIHNCERVLNELNLNTA